MIDLTREICLCNSVTAQEVVDVIKNDGITQMDQLINHPDTPCGDKCESCIEEGYENDGFSLLMILARVKQGRL
jgi:bacterioferritin-associated ferredoxin